MFYDKNEIEVNHIILCIGDDRPAVCASTVILVLLIFHGNAYAHGVGGGFASRQPDLGLAIATFSVSAFGILVLVARRVHMKLGASLIIGPLLGFAYASFEIARLGNQTDTFTLQTEMYYLVLHVLRIISLMGLVGGAIVTIYYMVARRPLIRKLNES